MQAAITFNNDFYSTMYRFFSELKGVVQAHLPQPAPQPTLKLEGELLVMLADDDEDDRFFFAQAVSELSPSIHLTTSRDGSELLQYLEKSNHRLPDLIFLDLNMPRKNGLECLEELKQHSKLKKIPVIIYSTSANPHQVEDTFKKGAHLYIQKPDSFSRIKEVLNKVLSLPPGKLPQPANRDTFLII